MASSRATRAPVGGTVWPVAALYGAISAAAAALGVWVASWLSGAARPWAVLDWVAEHALWGTLLGGLLALVVRLGARVDPSLVAAGQRRAASARLAAACVALGLLALAGASAGSRPQAWGHALAALAGGGFGLALAWTMLCRGLAGGARFRALPNLDPARVAALLALLTLPLAQGVRHAPESASQASLLGRGVAVRAQAPDSVLEAWRVMLER